MKSGIGSLYMQAMDSAECAEIEALLCPHSVVLTVQPKQLISGLENPSEHFFYIKEGETSHLIVGSDGSEKLLFGLTEGWIFGESQMITDKEFQTHIIARSKCVLYQVPKSVFYELFNENPVFREFALRCITEKVMKLCSEMENLSFCSCKVRLKNLYCANVNKDELLDGGWYNVDCTYTHYELAVIIGSARVTISKLINELCDEGFMRMINRKAQINAKQYEEHMKEYSIRP